MADDTDTEDAAGLASGTAQPAADPQLAQQAMGYRLWHGMGTPADHATQQSLARGTAQLRAPPPQPLAPNPQTPLTPAVTGAPPPSPVNPGMPTAGTNIAPPRMPAAPQPLMPAQGQQAPPQMLPRPPPNQSLYVSGQGGPQVMAPPPGAPVGQAPNANPLGGNPVEQLAQLRAMGGVSRDQQEQMAMMMRQQMMGTPGANPLMGNMQALPEGF
jgi:hypothetical protein